MMRNKFLYRTLSILRSIALTSCSASESEEYMKIHSTSMSMEERNKLYEQWQKERDKSIKKANNS